MNILKDIHISVIPNGWSDAHIQDIKVLLKDTASHINRELVSPFSEKIHVEKGDGSYPFTHPRSTQDEPHKISLLVEWDYWCQFAYQFAHEFCHVLSDYNRLKDCKNQWFHEAICELASVFTLRCMKKRWCTNPPFPNRKDYAESLAKYEDDMRKGYKKEWEDKYGKHSITLIDWLSDHEEEMRDISIKKNTNGDRHLEYRLRYALVAYALLPIFEEDPSGWNAIRFLPCSDSYIGQYLDEWSQLVEEPNRSFVRHCKKCIESDLTPFNT